MEVSPTTQVFSLPVNHGCYVPNLKKKQTSDSQINKLIKKTWLIGMKD